MLYTELEHPYEEVRLCDLRMGYTAQYKPVEWQTGKLINMTRVPGGFIMRLLKSTGHDNPSYEEVCCQFVSNTDVAPDF